MATRSPELVHFYHCWIGTDRGKRIAGEHWTLLDHMKFPGQVIQRTITEGWEDTTLRELHAFARKAPGDTLILYTHNKGAFHNDIPNTWWRRCMDDWLIGGWRDRVKELETHDIACTWWLPKGTIDPWKQPLQHPIAAGNFWWARADYLKGLPELPPLDEGNRIEGEIWLGQDDPAVAYRYNTWPVASPAEYAETFETMFW